MLGGKGFFRGSSVLVSGTAGTGKSSIAAKFASAACVRGENCLYFAFEESPKQIVRKMRSIGVDLTSGAPVRSFGGPNDFLSPRQLTADGQQTAGHAGLGKLCGLAITSISRL